MSDPFSEMPGMPRPTRRRFEPGLVQEALGALRQSLRAKLPVVQGALRKGRRVAKEALQRAQGHGRDLWHRGKRNPRTVGLAAGAVVLTLAGAYAVSASGAGRSLCPPPAAGKTAPFRVLMDPLPQAAAGSQVKIHYDVCGLPSGTAYSARIRLIQQQRTVGKKKKKTAKLKPVVVSFKDKVDGVATRRQQELSLASAKAGSYTLELLVTDNKGRQRKKVQKVVVKAVSGKRYGGTAVRRYGGRLGRPSIQ